MMGIQHGRGGSLADFAGQNCENIGVKKRRLPHRAAQIMGSALTSDAAQERNTRLELERIYRTKLLSEQQNAQCETKPLSIRHLQDGFDSNCQVIAVAAIPEWRAAAHDRVIAFQLFRSKSVY
jgi:hypothetical protein